MKILVMGVSGCGKSSFGRALAENLALPFFDADNFHHPSAVDKMAAGQPLCDRDRQPWLQKLAILLGEQPRLVLACSALKKCYRDLLRQSAPELQLCYLRGSFATILPRLKVRQAGNGHFFAGAAMLRSQFADLEEPSAAENPLILDVENSNAMQVQLACRQLRP